MAKKKTFADLMAEAALQGTTTSDLAELLKGAGVSLPNAGLGPVSPASRAGRTDSIAPTQETQRPNDYMAPVAELLSIPMGAYGAGQLVGSGVNAVSEGDYASGAGQFALGMAGMLPMAPKGGKGIRAFHGSPHDFERFDMSKIGTGEGAQAYGHGLYFAEAEDVARSYRDAITTRGNDPESGFSPASAGSEAYSVVNEEFGVSYDDLLKRGATEFEYDRRAFLRMPDGSVVQWGPSGPERALNVPTGHMYEVNIKADPQDFLDWDKRLRDQPEAIQEAMARIDDPMFRAWQENGAWPHNSGETLYRHLADGLTRKAHDEGRHVTASQALREAGIPGIRYLDQMSRGAGEGSSNYVVFDDAIIDIVRKYGIAGLALLQAAGYGTNEGDETQ